MAEEALQRVYNLRSADTDQERERVLLDFRALLDDAILLAPVAAATLTARASAGEATNED